MVGFWRFRDGIGDNVTRAWRLWWCLLGMFVSCLLVCGDFIVICMIVGGWLLSIFGLFGCFKIFVQYSNCSMLSMLFSSLFGCDGFFVLCIDYVLNEVWGRFVLLWLLIWMVFLQLVDFGGLYIGIGFNFFHLNDYFEFKMLCVLIQKSCCFWILFVVLEIGSFGFFDLRYLSW